MMESIFDGLVKEIEEGISGKNNSISVGLPKLGRYINIRKNILTLLFSTSGAGKSGMVDTMVLNSCISYMNNPSLNKLKPNFQLFSMERVAKLRIAKWICTLIYLNEGVEIQLPKMMGWWDDKLTKSEQSLIEKQKEFIDQMTNDFVTIHSGSKTPNEIYKILKDNFEKVGEYDQITIDGKTKKIYIPNDEKIIVSPIIDHGNLTKTTKELPTKKQAIDKLCSMIQDMRDLENCAPIWVAQVSRAINSITRTSDSEQELTLEDVKESGDIGDACDVAIALWDPYKYKQSSKTGYSPSDFIDKKNGNNYFRSAHVCKSSYGADGVRVPLAFLGFCGRFQELEKRNDISESEYKQLVQDVLSKKYFLNNNE